MSDPEYVWQIIAELAKIKKDLGMREWSARCCYEDVGVKQVIDQINRIKEDLFIGGDMQVYGSRRHGIVAHGSDLDITLLANIAVPPVKILEKFKLEFEKYFQNTHLIRNAKVPLLRATAAGMDIDFSIGQHLAIQKTELLRAYCHCDERVSKLGKELKEWLDARQLKGKPFLNSYTYTLMLIHYLQSCDPPVVPNLQAAAVVPWVSESTKSVHDLLIGFFEFFVKFKWERDAVSPRLNQAGRPIKKHSLNRRVKTWYIEDPLEHDNNAYCTACYQEEILSEMQKALSNLRKGGLWKSAYGSEKYILQCCTQHPISEWVLLKEFEYASVAQITSWKQNEGRTASVLLHFPDQESLQRALTKTGKLVDGCELKLLRVSSRMHNSSPVPEVSDSLEREVLEHLSGTGAGFGGMPFAAAYCALPGGYGAGAGGMPAMYFMPAVSCQPLADGWCWRPAGSWKPSPGPGDFMPSPVPAPPRPPLRHEALDSHVRARTEYLFSRENLIQDIYLRKQMGKEGWVDVDVLLTHRYLSGTFRRHGNPYQIQKDRTFFIEAFATSVVLETDISKSKLRLRDGWKMWPL